MAGRRKRTRKGKGFEDLDLEDPRVRGKIFEALWIEKFWIPELEKQGYATFYSKDRRYPEWLRQAFPDERHRPDLVAISRTKILVGDVTAGPWSTAKSKTGELRKLPHDIGGFETKPHLEKTIQDAEQLARNLPEEFRDYEIVARDRYRESTAKHSREITVYKDRRFTRPSTAGTVNLNKGTGGRSTAKRNRATTKGRPEAKDRTPTGRLPAKRSPAPLPKARLLSKGINMTRVRLSVRGALRLGRTAVRSIGKGLIIGAVIGLLTDMALEKLGDWVLEGLEEDTLQELETKRGPEIQRLMEEALADHIRRLARRRGTKYMFVVEFRLVYFPRPVPVFGGLMVGDLLVDRVYVTSEAGSSGCERGSVKKDLKGYPLHGAAEAVLKCRRVLEFDYPDVGGPSIAGKWTEYYWDNQGDRDSRAEFTVIEPAHNDKSGTVRVSGTLLPAGQEMTIRKATWDGRNLRFIARTRGAISKYWLTFSEWDVLTGTLNISTEFDRNPDGTRNWYPDDFIWLWQRRPANAHSADRPGARIPSLA